MRGVKFVTYAFVGILMMSVGISIWVSRFHSEHSRQRTDTFVRILSSCSILLTFVFYYNLIKSGDEARLRAEQQDFDRELDRINNARMELTNLFDVIPYSICSIIELNPIKKYHYARRALEEGELDKGLAEFRLKSIMFDLWVLYISLLMHRSPNIVSRVATIVTQAVSPILRSSWKVYSYQYPLVASRFMDTVYEVIDENIDCTSSTPQYQKFSLQILERTGHIDVHWNAMPSYYVFKETTYVTDQVEHYF